MVPGWAETLALAQHSNRSLFIKFLQISRLWSPQTCQFLQRSPSMTTQLGRKYLMKWRRSADNQTMSLQSLLPHIWRERMLHVETVVAGGLIITEVGDGTGGGGAVRPTLYRGYLDLRSGLEITPAGLDCTVTAHHSNHNRNNNNQTEIRPDIIARQHWTNVTEASVWWNTAGLVLWRCSVIP